MESQQARDRAKLARTADNTFDRIARSERTMTWAVDLLQNVHWYGSDLEIQILRREQITWLAGFIPAQSEQLDGLALLPAQAVEPEPALLYFPGVTPSV